MRASRPAIVVNAGGGIATWRSGVQSRCRIQGILVSREGCSLTAGCPGEDFVAGLGPGEGLAAVVPALDVGLDRGDEIFDRREGAAADRLAGGGRAEELHGQPWPLGGGVVQRDAGV